MQVDDHAERISRLIANVELRDPMVLAALEQLVASRQGVWRNLAAITDIWVQDEMIRIEKNDGIPAFIGIEWLLLQA